MRGVKLPEGFGWQRLQRDHPRKQFSSGQPEVDAWLRTKAWQHQKKHLSVIKVLLDQTGQIAGYYTLATGQLDFGDLPDEVTKRLPRRLLPVALLSWLGVSSAYQNQGLGRLRLAQALRDCYEAGGAFPFVAVILDCLTDEAKSFYKRLKHAAEQRGLSADPLAVRLLDQHLPPAERRPERPGREAAGFRECLSFRSGRGPCGSSPR